MGSCVSCNRQSPTRSIPWEEYRTKFFLFNAKSDLLYAAFSREGNIPNELVNIIRDYYSILHFLLPLKEIVLVEPHYAMDHGSLIAKKSNQTAKGYFVPRITSALKSGIHAFRFAISSKQMQYPSYIIWGICSDGCSPEDMSQPYKLSDNQFDHHQGRFFRMREKGRCFPIRFLGDIDPSREKIVFYGETKCLLIDILVDLSTGEMGTTSPYLDVGSRSETGTLTSITWVSIPKNEPGWLPYITCSADCVAMGVIDPRVYGRAYPQMDNVLKQWIE